MMHVVLPIVDSKRRPRKATAGHGNSDGGAVHDLRNLYSESPYEHEWKGESARTLRPLQLKKALTGKPRKAKESRPGRSCFGRGKN
jgi:hypothetical protein